jgi:hypothetical protein
MSEHGQGDELERIEGEEGGPSYKRAANSDRHSIASDNRQHGHASNVTARREDQRFRDGYRELNSYGPQPVQHPWPQQSHPGPFYSHRPPQEHYNYYNYPPLQPSASMNATARREDQRFREPLNSYRSPQEHYNYYNNPPLHPSASINATARREDQRFRDGYRESNSYGPQPVHHQWPQQSHPEPFYSHRPPQEHFNYYNNPPLQPSTNINATARREGSGFRSGHRDMSSHGPQTMNNGPQYSHFRRSYQN